MQIKNRTDDFSVYIHKIYCIYCTEQKGKLKYLSDKIHWALIPEKSRCKKSQIFYKHIYKLYFNSFLVLKDLTAEDFWLGHEDIEKMCKYSTTNN